MEKRPNSAGTAIVATVIEGSQAEAAGIQRGDALCYAGSNGQEEIMYDLFLELAKSNQRPLRTFDCVYIYIDYCVSGGLSSLLFVDCLCACIALVLWQLFFSCVFFLSFCVVVGIPFVPPFASTYSRLHDTLE